MPLSGLDAQVLLVDFVRVEVGCLADVDHLAAAEDVHLVGQRERALDVLLDDDERHAARGEPGEQPVDLVDDARGQAQLGSSTRMTFGLVRYARDNASICCSPPDRLPAVWPSASSAPGNRRPR